MFDNDFNGNFERVQRTHRRVGAFLMVWFAIVAIIAFSIFGFVGYTLYTAFTLAGDPEAIGNYVGKIQSGYERAIQE